MSTATCSQCGAPLRADQSWCSLCFARVPEAFDPLTAPLEELAGAGEPLESPSESVTAPTVPTVPSPATASRGRHAAEPAAVDPAALEPAQETEPRQPGELWQPPSWMAEPQARSGAESPALTDSEPQVAGDAEDPDGVKDIDVMLSMLSAEHRAMDRTSGFSERMEDKGTRVAIMVGGALIVGAVLFLGFTVLGAIF